MDRHAGKMRSVVESVLEGPGELDPAIRKAIAGEGDREKIPPALLPYLDKVAHSAWTMTDEDVQALRRSGLTEDQIYEATVAAALGAGLERLRAGLAVLGEGGE